VNEPTLLHPRPDYLAACFRRQTAQFQTLIGQPDWDWDALFADASTERVLPALSGVLPAGLPAPIAEFLKAVAEANRERNHAIRAELKHAVRLLNGIGLEPVLLKGVAYLETGVYPDIAARYLVDVDLLLPETRRHAGASALLEAGYVAEDRDAFGHFRHHHPPLRSPGSVSFELHHRMGRDRCERLLPASEVIAGSLPHDLDGLRARVPCPEHLLTHLIVHSQLQHPYNERIWPPLRAMSDLVLLNRRFGSELNWEAVEHRFRASGRYALFALHLMQVNASLGMELPVALRLGPVTRLRWHRRQFLRRRPSLRYADPVYMFSTVLSRRIAMLRKLLTTPHGTRHLLTQILAPRNYARLWTDLIEGRGR